jgi:hypothetical protein
VAVGIRDGGGSSSSRNRQQQPALQLPTLQQVLS